ncbi:hypothetical protein AAMO2058_000818700 [Amorphochlora amoebiformis]
MLPIGSTGDPPKKKAREIASPWMFLLGLVAGFALSMVLVLAFVSLSGISRRVQPHVATRQRAVPLKDYMAQTQHKLESRYSGDVAERDQLVREVGIVIACVIIGAYVVGIVPATRFLSTNDKKTDACMCCMWVSRATSLLGIEDNLGTLSFRCPITLQVMQDPVVCADGHTYERNAIQHWLKKNNRSPTTNLPLTSTNLIPNHCIRSAIHASSIGEILDLQDPKRK